MRPHLRFEWDEAKRLSNLRRHGIDFAELAEFFEGGLTFDLSDNRYEYNEERVVTLGFWKGRVLVVVHTGREDNIRLISARRASKNEEIKYFKEIWD
jgi:uncharacterized DUF497 family protein